MRMTTAASGIGSVTPCAACARADRPGRRRSVPRTRTARRSSARPRAAPRGGPTASARGRVSPGGSARPPRARRCARETPAKVIAMGSARSVIRAVAVSEGDEQSPAGRIGQRGIRPIQDLIFNHLVDHNTPVVILNTSVERSVLAVPATPPVTEPTRGRIMDHHAVVSGREWVEARRTLLVKEKEFARLREQLGRQRRDLPWEAVTRNTSSKVPTVR